MNRTEIAKDPKTSLLYMSLYYLTSVVKADDYENPFITKYSREAFPVTIQTRTSVTLTYQVLEVQTDDGLIFSNNNVTTSAGVSSIITNTLFYSDTVQFFGLAISLDQMNSVYKRSYLKLQTVLANTGGILRLIIVLFIFIAEYFSDFNVIENLYVSSVNDGIEGIVNDNSCKEISLATINNINNNPHDVKTILSRDTNNNATVVDSKKDFKKGENTGNVARFSFIKNVFFCCFKLDRTKFLAVQGNIKKHFEIYNLLKLSSFVQNWKSGVNNFENDDVVVKSLHANQESNVKIDNYIKNFKS